MTRRPAVRAALRKSGSMAGRELFSLGPLPYREPAVANHQVTVGTGDVDAAGPEGVAIVGMHGGEGPGPAQDAREYAAG